MNQDEIAVRTNDIAQSAAHAAWWSAGAAVLTALLTIGLLVGAFLAWRAAMAAVQQAKETHEQMQRDSIEQTRPYVYVHLVPGLAGLATWDLLITNTGKSTARKLTIDCNPWPDKDDAVTEALKIMFSTGRSLPPGSSIRTFWKLGTPEEGSNVGIASGATLTLNYTSDDPSNPAYIDEYHLDDSTIGLTPTPYKGPTMKTGLTNAEKDLHNVLAAVASNIGELRR